MDLTFELIKLIVLSVIFASAYNLVRYVKKLVETGEKWDIFKFLPTAIYSVILGFIMVFTGVINLGNITNFEALFGGAWVTYLTLFTFILYVWENVVVPFLKARLTVTEFYKITAIDPLSKMNEVTRKWLVSDRTPEMGAKVLNAVDAAQDLKTYRYCINSGPWEYLVEFGIVTGGKHYFWKGWFGDGTVLWKPISVACLETIRKTGKWPDYGKLY